MVINGEIYNHRALRRDLESRGHRFATGSDGEVVVHLYEEMGERCVNLLAGMFAFAVADFGRRRLLLARDRVGKKPLYLADDGRSVAFASELKALRAGGVELAIDPEALDLYLALGYVPAPWTIAAGVRKLPAGHLAVCDGNGLRTARYWDVQDAAQGARPLMVRGGGRRAERVLEERLTDELEARLAAAVGARLESEVPLGAFLSGGIDSGVVVAMMGEALRQPVLTHTVGFADRERDERAAAAAVARFLGTDHAEFEVRPELADLLPRIAWHLDEPFADPSTVPTWYVARETRRRVTVALSGDGGDELFAGYPARYRMHLAERRLRPLLPAAFARRALPPLARLGRARRGCRGRCAPGASSRTSRSPRTAPTGTTAAPSAPACSPASPAAISPPAPRASMPSAPSRRTSSARRRAIPWRACSTSTSRPGSPMTVWSKSTA